MTVAFPVTFQVFQNLDQHDENYQLFLKNTARFVISEKSLKEFQHVFQFNSSKYLAKLEKFAHKSVEKFNKDWKEYQKGFAKYHGQFLGYDLFEDWLGEIENNFKQELQRTQESYRTENRPMTYLDFCMKYENADFTLLINIGRNEQSFSHPTLWRFDFNLDRASSDPARYMWATRESSIIFADDLVGALYRNLKHYLSNQYGTAIMSPNPDTFIRGSLNDLEMTDITPNELTENANSESDKEEIPPMEINDQSPRPRFILKNPRSVSFDLPRVPSENDQSDPNSFVCEAEVYNPENLFPYEARLSGHEIGALPILMLDGRAKEVEL